MNHFHKPGELSQPRAEDMAEALKIGSGSFQHNLDHWVDEWLHIDMHSK